jgi:uncharacterized protein YegP (UPF0339 family)
MKGFNFYTDHRGQWYWQLKDGTDVIVADSAEDYHNEAGCKHGAAVFTKEGVTAPEREGKKHGGPAYEYFSNDGGANWHWHFQAGNNKIIADNGSRAFKSAAETQKKIAEVRQLLKDISGGSTTPPTTGGGSGGTYVPPVKPAPGPKNPPYPPTDRPVG